MVRLIPFEKAAAGFIMESQLDPDYSRFFRDLDYLMTWEQCNDFDKLMGRQVFILGIDENSKQKPVGLVTILTHGVNGTADIGMMIIKSYWGTDVTNESYDQVENYVFKKCNMRKICLQVLSNDEHTLNSNERHGYVREGKLKDHCLFHGKLQDIIILSKFKKGD